MKEKFILGITSFVTGAMLFGMTYIAITLYIPNMDVWNSPPGKFQSALSQTSGWFPFILSIGLMIAGVFLLAVHYRRYWDVLMNKEVPEGFSKKLVPAQEITWENMEHYGSEKLRLEKKGFSLFANGLITIQSKEEPYVVNYELELDNKWHTKKVDVTIGDRTLAIWSDGEGNWYSKDRSLTELDSSIDVDIEATPFSNSLPINRHDWFPNQTREFNMVYIAIPSLVYTKRKQSYTYMDNDGPYRVFQYKCGKFETHITVDNEGVVIDYPNVFERRY